MTNMNPKLCSTHRKLRGKGENSREKGPGLRFAQMGDPLPSPVPFSSLIPSDHGMGSQVLVCAHLGISG